MIKILRDCLGSRYVKWVAVGAIVVVAGLLAWGVAPKLILSALPLLSIAVCVVPCLLALVWLRRSGTSSPAPISPQVDDRPASTGPTT